MALVAERAPVVNTEWVSLVLKDSDAATCGAKICEARIFLTEVLWAICDKKMNLDNRNCIRLAAYIGKTRLYSPKTSAIYISIKCLGIYVGKLECI